MSVSPRPVCASRPHSSLRAGALAISILGLTVSIGSGPAVAYSEPGTAQIIVGPVAMPAEELGSIFVEGQCPAGTASVTVQALWLDGGVLGGVDLAPDFDPATGAVSAVDHTIAESRGPGGGYSLTLTCFDGAGAFLATGSASPSPLVPDFRQRVTVPATAADTEISGGVDCGYGAGYADTIALSWNRPAGPTLGTTTLVGPFVEGAPAPFTLGTPASFGLSDGEAVELSATCIAVEASYTVELSTRNATFEITASSPPTPTPTSTPTPSRSGAAVVVERPDATEGSARHLAASGGSGAVASTVIIGGVVLSAAGIALVSRRRLGARSGAEPRR